MRFPGAAALLCGLLAAIPAGRAHAQTAEPVRTQPTTPVAHSLQDGLDIADSTAAAISMKTTCFVGDRSIVSPPMWIGAHRGSGVECTSQNFGKPG